MAVSKEKPKASARNFFGGSSKRYVWEWVPRKEPGISIAMNKPDTDGGLSSDTGLLTI